MTSPPSFTKTQQSSKLLEVNCLKYVSTELLYALTGNRMGTNCGTSVSLALSFLRRGRL